MKEQILKLRSEGKSYREIESLLGCSKGTINYHCSKQGKAQNLRRRQRLCRSFMNELKASKGGCCKFCGYSRCFDGLDFHHVDPSMKDKTYRSIAAIFRNCSKQRAMEEVAKCILICALCHRELHAGVRNADGHLIGT